MNIICSFMDYCGVMRREGKTNPDETIADFRCETVTDIIKKCVDLVGFESVMRIALDQHEMNIMNDMQDVYTEAKNKMGSLGIVPALRDRLDEELKKKR